MRALVTGAAGFIGTHLLDRWPEAEGLDVQAMPGRCGRLLDVRDEKHLVKLVQRERYSVIVHLAAIPGVAADDGLDTQIRGTLAVLRAAAAVGARVVLASSAAVYSLPEFSGHTGWTSQYAIGKRSAELLAEISEASAISLRFSNVYGAPWPKGVVAAFRDAARTGREPVITDPGLSRDFIHVHDVVEAIVIAAETDYLGAVDICTGQEITLLELWNRIAALHGRSCVYREGEPRPMDRPSSETSPTAAENALGWEANIPLGEGLMIP